MECPLTAPAVNGRVLASYAVAVVGGAGTWIGLALATGKQEAWDHPLYFLVGLPLLTVLVAALGYLNPSRAWRWGVAAGASQCASLFLLQRRVGPLLLLGLIFLAFITCALVAAALAGAALAQWRRRWHAG